jgi:hypothetical protein
MTDSGINLDFGGVDAIMPGEPVPDGVYVLRVDDAQIIPTKDGRNNMIQVTCIVNCPENHPLSKYNTRRIIDNWFLPNPATQTPDDVRTTKGYLRGKLEMVTQKDWSQDGMRLVPRELAGYEFKALVAKVDEGYGPQNRIRRYMRLDAEMEIGLTTPSPQPQLRRNESTHLPVGAGVGEAPGRFRI